ncbi:MAG: shikimate kinase [Proteocatella sp.]
MKKILKNIVLIGMPGCGKTSIGEKLAKRLNLEFCDVDAYIEEKWKMTIPEIFKKGETYFREIETEALEEISKSYPKVISTGGGTVKNQRNIEILKQNGIIIYTNRPVEEIVRDIDVETRPLLTQGREMVYQLYEERHHLYQKYSDIEIVNDGSEEDLIAKIVSFL